MHYQKLLRADIRVDRRERKIPAHAVQEGAFSHPAGNLPSELLQQLRIRPLNRDKILLNKLTVVPPGLSSVLCGNVTQRSAVRTDSLALVLTPGFSGSKPRCC